MRIGVNTLFHVPGDIGGTETYLRELLLAIAQEFPHVSLTLFTTADNDALLNAVFAKNANVVTNCLPFRASYRPMRILCEQLWLPLRVRTSNVDVLWSPGYTAPYAVSCPQVVTIHDLQYKSHPDDLTWLERQTLDTLVRMACRRCRRVITVSAFSKSELIKHGCAATEKVVPILAGVDGSFEVDVPGPEVEHELPPVLTQGRPYILAVAHTYPHKNVDQLVTAFGLIYQHVPHDLVLVGKKRLGEPVLQKALDRLPCRNRVVRLTSGVSYAALKHLYQHADVFVLPSAYEGFGLPVLEAMMSGTPVVTSKMASIPEVAGEHAFYYHNGDCQALGNEIKAVIALTPEQRSLWCERAHTWAKQFTWTKAARETIAVLEECTKGREQC